LIGELTHAMQVSVLNAGGQTDYLYGLVSGLAAQDEVHIDVVDGDASQNLFREFPSVRHENLRGDNRSSQSVPVKLLRIARYYFRLMAYAVTSSSAIFHIQWDNSFLLFDRTFLLLFYKLCGKKIVYTAHNISTEARDKRETWYHVLSLKALYRWTDAVIVHTEAMKQELCSRFHVREDKVTVIRHGLNVRIAVNNFSAADARIRLGIPADAKVVLFFGHIDAYKGLDVLLDAAREVMKEDPKVYLLIAGKLKRGAAGIAPLNKRLAATLPADRVMTRFEFVPPEEIEWYFAAADCTALPYRRIYQSGVLFLSYRFGVPVVATDIASFAEDILEGITGMLCPPENIHAFAAMLRRYFLSSLYLKRAETRNAIRTWAEERYSWNRIGQETVALYAKVLANR
jgi:glycosyltransferase involved in cell wall biosynthesis